MERSQSRRSGPTAQDIIFSCHICQASIYDIYGPGAAKTDFQDGRPQTADRRVTSLWLTGCMHLTCGGHLEGGGAPFHPKGEHPQAPCPVCLKAKGDARPRPLYAVRGLKKGSIDPDIPETLFRVPPTKFEGQGLGLEALKFQYMSLIGYGTSMLTKYHELDKAKRRVEQNAMRLDAENRALLKENRELKKKVAAENSEQSEVEKWRKRIPQIRHYLEQFPKAVQEIEDLRAQLSQLGYAVPKRDYSRRSPEPEKTDPARLPDGQRQTKTPRVPTDSRTEYATAQTQVSESSSGRKRKLAEYAEGLTNSDIEPQPQARSEVQSTVPHPANPGDPAASREPASVRNHSPNNSSIPSDPANIPEINLFHDGLMGNEPHVVANGYVERVPNAARQPRRDKYTMSGAIPASASVMRQRPPNPTHHLERVPSRPPHAVQTQQPRGYQDETTYHIYDREQQSTLQSQLLHPHRSLLGERSQSSINRQPVGRPPTRGNQMAHLSSRPPAQPHYPQQTIQARRLEPFPTTPSPRKVQNPGSGYGYGPNLASSPYFLRGSDGAQSGLTAGVAGLTANARVGTVYRPSHQMAPPQHQWNQPRSLNGLSFIHEPRDQFTGAPIFHTSNRRTLSDNYNNVNTRAPPDLQRTDDGLFRKPEQSRVSSSYFNSMPPTPSVAQMKHPGQFHMAQMSRHAPQSSRRTFTRDDALNMVTRPSNNAPTSFYQNQTGRMSLNSLPNGLPTAQRGLFSSASGRRSVRR